MRFLILIVALVGCSEKQAPRDQPNKALAELARKCTHDAEVSCARPIFNVKSLKASQTYYREALGFKLDWDHGEPADFGSVSRGDGQVFLCQGCQGIPGAWIMLFVRDVDKLHAELVERKAIIKMPPTNMPWGMREMQVEDPDGNVMRFGSSLDHH
jgi:catechol 2,3-dioxygenase-like lactoylglutathione lyase family enzyme